MELIKLSEDRYITMKDVPGLQRIGKKLRVGFNMEVTYESEDAAKAAMKVIVDGVGAADISNGAIEYKNIV